MSPLQDPPAAAQPPPPPPGRRPSGWLWLLVPAAGALGFGVYALARPVRPAPTPPEGSTPLPAASPAASPSAPPAASSPPPPSSAAAPRLPCSLTCKDGDMCVRGACARIPYPHHRVCRITSEVTTPRQVYSKASRRSKVLQDLPPGTRIPQGVMFRENWLEVVLENGTKGYMERDWLECD